VSDTAVRRRIGPWDPSGVADLSDFDAGTNYFVRAAAGSGKTTSLVARMVALVREGVPVDSIAAITFTRKAAGEMNKRFYEELQQAYRGLPIETEQRRRVAIALENVHSAFIGTVHSFCARLLRERPLSVGLPPDFVAGIDERDERDLREQAWQTYLQRVRRDDPEQLERLTELGVEPEDLMTYFETLCRYPELDPYTNAPDERPDLGGAVREATRFMRRWQERRPDDPEGGRDAVMKALDRAANMLRYQDLDTPAEKAAFLELFADVSSEERARVTLSRWGDRGSEAHEEARRLRDDALPGLIRDVIAPVLRPWHATVHEAVVSFTRPAVEIFRELRRRDGQLTFHDLLQFTRDLLRDHPDVRRYFQDRYRRLLVDEFQDTDPLQAEILFYLTSEDATERSWTDCTPRPGSLFIVGDDKQSIYRFRRADKDVFAQVGRLIDASGGEVVDLTKNFRSLGRICGFCDRAFRSIFQQEGLRDLQANYVGFDPQRPDGRDDVALRRIEIDKVYRNRGADIAQADAEQIAAFIRSAQTGNLDDHLYGSEEADDTVFAGEVTYADFLILTRRKANLSVYAETLARHGIPYTITGSEDLGASDELRAVVDLLTCALRPDDPVATVAVLKGPLAGLSDDDLYRYKSAGGRFDRAHQPVPDDVQTALEEADRSADADSDLAVRVQSAFDRIQTARRLLLQYRPAVATEKIVDRLGLLAGAAHPPDAAEASLRAGYVLRIVTLVQHLASQGEGWAQILEELQQILDGEQAVDGMTLETGGGDAVRIMNVHQAKGLEANVVFLADPYSSGSGHGATLHVRRETGELVAPVVQGEDHYQRVTHAPLGWHDESDAAFRALEERHAQAEEHRLLYVAATRAENLLVVSTYPEKPGDGYWSDLYPYLEAVEAPVLDLAPPPEPAGRSAPAPNLHAHREEREQRIARAHEAGYTEASMTEELKTVSRELGSEPGYGPDFGTAVHRLFEECLQRGESADIPSSNHVRATLNACEASTGSGAVDLARAMVHGLLRSDLWTQICAAEIVFPEYPLAELQHRSRDPRPPLLRSGQIDVVYRRDDEWQIVDFKTDHIADDRVLEALTEAYAPQIEAYVEAWQRATGEAIDTAGLWFADAETFVAVQTPEPADSGTQAG